MKSKVTLLTITCGMIAAMSLSSSVNASVLEEALVASQTEATNTLSVIYGPPTGSPSQTKGATFTPDQNGVLSRIGVKLTTDGGPNANWKLKMTAYETDRSLPTTAIGSVELAISDIASSGLTYFDFSAFDLSIDSGTRYAFMLELPEATSYEHCVRIWRTMSPQNCNEFSLSSTDGGDIFKSSGYVPKYKVFAMVPEPASLGLFAVGSVLTFLRRR